MAVNDDKTTSGDNIKMPKFDHSNKTVSRDSRIRAYTQSFKCAAMAKYGTAGGALFQPLAITKAGATPPSLHFAKKGKIAKVAPAFYAHDPEVFKTRLLDEGWEPDFNQNQTSTTWRSLRLLLHAFTASARATLSRLLLI